MKKNEPDFRDYDGDAQEGHIDCDEEDITVSFSNKSCSVRATSKPKSNKNRNVSDVGNQIKRSSVKQHEEQTMCTNDGASQKGFVDLEEGLHVSDYVLLMENLVKKFREENDKQKKLQILTLAPHSWSRKKIISFFGAPERQVRQAQKQIRFWSPGHYT